MALTTARISSSRWRPPGLGGGSEFLIRSHSASVRSVGYGLAVIPPVYRTGATYGRLFKQPLSVVLLYEIHEIQRFPRVQDFVSYCRLVTCAKESAGKRYGTAGAKIGTAPLKWACAQAAVLVL